VLGVIDRLERRPPGVRLAEGHRIVVLGRPAHGGLAGSRLAADHGHARQGTLPPVDLAAVRVVADLVRDLVLDGVVGGAHDVAEGGLGLALAEMAVASGVGFQVARVHGLGDLFGESSGRVVLSVAPDDLDAVLGRAAAAGVEATRLGLATGDRLVVRDVLDVDLADAVSTWRDRLPEALGHGTTQG
jgi:phosphoribosylformylglycinamidine (FGAM) synthase-like enzyme